MDIGKQKVNNSCGDPSSLGSQLFWNNRAAERNISGIVSVGILVSGCAVIPATTTTTSSVANMQPMVQSPEIMMRNAPVSAYNPNAGKPVNEVTIRLVVEQ